MNSSREETVILSAGTAQMTLPQNGVIDAEGNNYDGDYEVYMGWISPTDINLNESIVGDLSGIDREDNLVGLSTFGMLQVELLGTDGKELNLADGAQAELQFPVPPQIRNRAPAIIPLWSYNEDFGYWIEEGQAELIEGRYIGMVSHFSSWNVDSKFDPIDLSGDIDILTRDNEVGLSYFEARLSGETFNSVGGWLCDDGSFTFRNIPSGEAVTLEIINYCGDVFHTEELGTFNEDTELETILLSTEEELNSIAITGNALSCNGSTVKNGLAVVAFQNRNLAFPIDENGQFNFLVFLCNELSGKMTILNLDDFNSSTPIPITKVNNNYHLEDLSLCEESEEYFYFEWRYGHHITDTGSVFIVNPEEVWYHVSNNEYSFELNHSFLGVSTHTSFVFTQELIENTIIQGVEDDGFNFISEAGDTTILFGGDYKFLFTEIGPPDQNGNPSVIQGTVHGKGSYGFDSFDFNGAFRLKPQ